ncbi:MAG: D-alanyl-D-alanine carboxypeptidase [Defluviitaleaceae bacterium]|nr:D-alanyl-D-alanine carboxypeptidase [Defluviitaleaceae bacterium]
MRKKMRNTSFAMLSILLISLLIPSPGVYGQNDLPLQATAAILVEQTTGRVLYQKNAHQPMYPASTTKLLTALVVIQHLDLDRIVVVGPEIRGMPAGFATNLHVEGEEITVEVLLKALLIRSSNEAGRVLALEVVRTVEGRANISYADAKPRFSQLMNQMAASLGAENSHFNNPYGLHNDAHFTTAYDLALIARAFMEQPVLMGIAAMGDYVGDGLGGRGHPEANVRQYSLVNTNLMLPGATFGHPYIIGGRTGFTTPAGHCFVGLARHDGLSLVSVVLDSTDVERWQDTRMLIDYGFINYAFRDVAADGAPLGTVYIQNPRLGDPETLDIFLSHGHTALLSRAEYASIAWEINFDPLYEVLLYGEAQDAGDATTLRAPLESGATVGTITYTAGGQALFTAPVVTARAVYERTFDSDMDFYMDRILSNIFTIRGLPYWFGVVGTLFGIVGISMAVSANRKAKRSNHWQPQGPRRRL